MGILEILTLIFIVLKLTGTIDWSWWWVLSPALFSFALTGFLVAIAYKCGARLR